MAPPGQAANIVYHLFNKLTNISVTINILLLPDGTGAARFAARTIMNGGFACFTE
jgi:hypothetical protein